MVGRLQGVEILWRHNQHAKPIDFHIEWLFSIAAVILAGISCGLKVYQSKQIPLIPFDTPWSPICPGTAALVSATAEGSKAATCQHWDAHTTD